LRVGVVTAGESFWSWRDFCLHGFPGSLRWFAHIMPQEKNR
jgi:hypothetical protein